MSTILNGLFQILYPPHCLVCGAAMPEDTGPVCSACSAQLFHDPWETCPRCAGTVGPFAVLEGRCAVCRNETYHFDRTLRLGLYEGLRREVVFRLKQARGEPLAEVVGQSFARRDSALLAGEGIDLVIPVPLHWRRRWWRGYNQSAALAMGMAEILHRPCILGQLRRIRATPYQTRQSLEGRRDNVRGAFRCRGRLDGRCVLLVDDVFTTGSTASEAAGALKEVGAARVVVAVLTRAHSG
jgi:ComF family protein